MSQRERVPETRRLALEIIKRVIKKKPKLEIKGFVYISSKEIYRHCLDELADENKCIGVTTIAAKLLNRYAIRLGSYRPKWRITTELLKKLFSIDEDYESLRETPLNRLDDIHFLYIVTTLLYEAKPEGEEDGNGG